MDRESWGSPIGDLVMDGDDDESGSAAASCSDGKVLETNKVAVVMIFLASIKAFEKYSTKGRFPSLTV